MPYTCVAAYSEAESEISRELRAPSRGSRTTLGSPRPARTNDSHWLPPTAGSSPGCAPHDMAVQADTESRERSVHKHSGLGARYSYRWSVAPRSCPDLTWSE